MMRVAYVAEKRNIDSAPPAKRSQRKSLKQLADEALQERRAFDRMKALKKYGKEREELNQLLLKLNQLKNNKI